MNDTHPVPEARRRRWCRHGVVNSLKCFHGCEDVRENVSHERSKGTTRWLISSTPPVREHVQASQLQQNPHPAHAAPQLRDYCDKWREDGGRVKAAGARVAIKSPSTCCCSCANVSGVVAATRAGMLHVSDARDESRAGHR